MAPPSRFGRFSLAAIFFLFLSLLNIATAAPLLENDVGKTLTTRNTGQITQAEYETYLKKYFPNTDKYLFYSGNSEAQVKAFKAKNAGYLYYDDLFNTGTNDKHPWYEAFSKDGVDRMDDGEASSKAMANVAKGQVLVFGAIEYKDAGKSSFFAVQEAPLLKAGFSGGRVTSINHMAKDATSTTQIMAKENASGAFAWEAGHKEGDKNASGVYGVCKRGPGGCDAPTIQPKKSKAKTGPKL